MSVEPRVSATGLTLAHPIDTPHRSGPV